MAAFVSRDRDGHDGELTCSAGKARLTVSVALDLGRGQKASLTLATAFASETAPARTSATATKRKSATGRASR